MHYVREGDNQDRVRVRVGEGAQEEWQGPIMTRKSTPQQIYRGSFAQCGSVFMRLLTSGLATGKGGLDADDP